jgi:hypothetical protein
MWSRIISLPYAVVQCMVSVRRITLLLAVSIVTDYHWLHKLGSNPGRKRYFFLPHNVQTACGANTAPSLASIGIMSRGKFEGVSCWPIPKLKTSRARREITLYPFVERTGTNLISLFIEFHNPSTRCHCLCRSPVRTHCLCRRSVHTFLEINTSVTYIGFVFVAVVLLKCSLGGSIRCRGCCLMRQVTYRLHVNLWSEKFSFSAFRSSLYLCMTWRRVSLAEPAETGNGKSDSEYLQPSKIF